MNKSAIRELINHLKKTTSFDQLKYCHPNGIPACIAGHTVDMKGYIINPETEECHTYYHVSIPGYRDSIWKRARVILGLSMPYAKSLFTQFPMLTVGKEFKPTKEDAIATLEYLLNEGVVKWQKAI